MHQTAQEIGLSGVRGVIHPQSRLGRAEDRRLDRSPVGPVPPCIPGPPRPRAPWGPIKWILGIYCIVLPRGSDGRPGQIGPGWGMAVKAGREVGPSPPSRAASRLRMKTASGILNIKMSSYDSLVWLPFTLLELRC